MANSILRGWTGPSKGFTRSNIRIIMGTPTYSIPAWLFKEHPEIVITKLGGQTISYGLRQNTDLANPTYLYCERVIRKILEHYKNNQDIIGFQIDNKTSSGGAANHDVQGGSEWRARSEMPSAWFAAPEM